MRDFMVRVKQSFEEIVYRLLNPVFFFLRGVIGFRRNKAFSDKPGGTELLPEYARKQLNSDRHNRLERRFHLDEYDNRISAASSHGAYFFLDVLEQASSKSSRFVGLKDEVEVLDVGTKNFDAAPALYNFFRYVNTTVVRKVHVTGIEVDAYRVYRSFYSRYDLGRFYQGLITCAGSKESHQYIAGDFIGHSRQYDVVTCFFPFLNSYALLSWGLPKRLLNPEVFLCHLLGCIKPGGMGVIINQTEEERDLQQQLLLATGLPFESFEIPLHFRKDQPLAFLHVLNSPKCDGTAEET